MNKSLSIFNFEFKNLFRASNFVLRIFVFATIGVLWLFFGAKTTHASACVSQAGGAGSWNSTASWTCGRVPTTADSVQIAAAQDITVDVTTAAVTSITIDSGATLNGGSYTISTTGSWSNLGTFTASTSTVKFTATSGSYSLSGTLNGTSSFYKVIFDAGSGNNPTWTIEDPMIVSAANAADTLVINYGTVTVGNGTGDSLEVNGETKIAYASGYTATLQTMSGLAPGSTVTIDINNNASPANCTNCFVEVGFTSGAGQGNLIINKNTILRLNSDNTNSDTYIQNESTGKVQMLGSLDYADQASTGATETTLTDTARSAEWTTNSEANKYLRISSGLAEGLIYPITSNTTTELTYTTTASASFTETVSGSGSGRKVCSDSTTLITADNQQAGRYLYDETSSDYFLIRTSINADAACGSSFDSFSVVPYPGTITSLATGHTAHISDGLQATDHYEIEQFAHLTAQSGTACTSTVDSTKAPYYSAPTGSETVMNHADVCNLGRGTNGIYAGIATGAVNGANANEGVSVNYTWIKKNNYAMYLGGGKNNNATYSKGIVKTTVQQAYKQGIYIITGVGYNLIDQCLFYSGHAVSLQSRGNIVSNSTFTSSSPTLTSNNQIYDSDIIRGALGLNGNGIFVSNLNLIGYTSYPISIGTSTNNYFYNVNISYALEGIHLGNSVGKNIFNNLTIHDSYRGLYYLGASNNNIFVSPSLYSNTYAFQLSLSSSGNSIINGNFGSLGANTYDFRASSSSNYLTLYNTTLTSTINGITSANSSGIISKKDAGSGGVTKIWGAYTTPTAVAETPQAEETDKYDYASNSWEKSASVHSYYGTGTEDTDLNYDLSTSDLSAGPYAYRASATDATTFAIYRDEVSVGNATVGSTFTDTNAGVNVSFKIDGGSPTAYVVGDQYSFVVWDASGDTNTTKTVSPQQNDDTVTVAAATTMSFDGGASNHSTLSIASNSFDLINNGTVSGGNNDLTVPGTISGSGTFNMGTGSTVENRVMASKNFGSTSGALNWVFDTLTFSNPSVTNNYTITAATGGTGVISATTMNVGKSDDIRTTTFDNETNDRTLNLGNLNISSQGLFTASSTAPLTVSGNYTNSGTFTANSGTINMNGVGQQTLSGTMTGANAFYNLTLSNPSGTDASDDERTGFVPGIIFGAAATATNTYAITTPSCRVQYHSGDTYTWNNINWVGSLGRMIFFRNSATSGTWLTKVTGTQSVSYVNVSRSDASVSGGSAILANNGTSHDGTNNTNWTFGGTVKSTQINGGTINIGTGTVNIK
ncbi:MAG: hypothetical protein WC773_01800 [Patescibacteria group bacterium]|jgi:hypothetical protein